MTALSIRYGAAQAIPIDVLLSTLPSLPRSALNRLVERAIDHMDAIDGDPDLEDDGDEQDGNTAEDEPVAWFALRRDGPGCAVSDPAWIEDENGL